MKKLFKKDAWMKIVPSTIAVVAMGVQAYANTPNNWLLSMLNSDKPVGMVLSMMWTAFKIIGAVLIVFGAVQMGFAFKNDDADGKTKGMRAALSGAIVVAIGFGAEAMINAIV